MRITMKTLSAHPDGTLENGRTYEVPGQVNVQRAKELLAGGYAVRADEDLADAEPAAAPVSADGSTDGKPLERRNVAELRQFAGEHDIDLGDAVKKAELLDRITTELARRETENDDE